MCRADIQVLTYKWLPDALFPAADKSSPHECVNWEKLYDWSEKNSVDMFEPGVLVHPILGTLCMAKY